MSVQICHWTEWWQCEIFKMCFSEMTFVREFNWKSEPTKSWFHTVDDLNHWFIMTDTSSLVWTVVCPKVTFKQMGIIASQVQWRGSSLLCSDFWKDSDRTDVCSRQGDGIGFLSLSVLMDGALTPSQILLFESLQIRLSVKCRGSICNRL